MKELKMLLWKTSQNSQENNYTGISVLIKLQSLVQQFYQKETQVFYCDFDKVFQNGFFKEL